MLQLLRVLFVLTLFIVSSAAFAQTADNSLTIYNQNFAVVRQPIALNLTTGDNHVTNSNVTAHLEPDSVVLRDPSGKRALHIFEQNYLADPINQGRLLDQSVGKTLEFVKPDGTMVIGKVIRSGYTPSGTTNSYGYQQQQYGQQPIIEVGNKLHLSLPGMPRFDSLGPDMTLSRPSTGHSPATSPARSLPSCRTLPAA